MTMRMCWSYWFTFCPRIYSGNGGQKFWALIFAISGQKIEKKSQKPRIGIPDRLCIVSARSDKSHGNEIEKGCFACGSLPLVLGRLRNQRVLVDFRGVFRPLPSSYVSYKDPNDFIWVLWAFYIKKNFFPIFWKILPIFHCFFFGLHAISSDFTWFSWLYEGMRE